MAQQDSCDAVMQLQLLLDEQEQQQQQESMQQAATSPHQQQHGCDEVWQAIHRVNLDQQATLIQR